MSEDHLEENIVCGGCVEGCSIASPITLHVIDLDAVAIVALENDDCDGERDDESSSPSPSHHHHHHIIDDTGCWEL